MLVVEGTSVRRQGKGGGRWEEKEVDILLAVDALEFAARGVVRYAVVLAGDMDYVPLVETLIRLGIFVKVASYEWRKQDKLLDAADDRQVIDAQDLWEIGTTAWRSANPTRIFRDSTTAYHVVSRIELERTTIELMTTGDRTQYAIRDIRLPHCFSCESKEILKRYADFRYRTSLNFSSLR